MLLNQEIYMGLFVFEDIDEVSFDSRANVGVHMWTKLKSANPGIPMVSSWVYNPQN
jgi:hypothetical protein